MNFDHYKNLLHELEMSILTDFTNDCLELKEDMTYMLRAQILDIMDSVVTIRMMINDIVDGDSNDDEEEID